MHEHIHICHLLAESLNYVASPLMYIPYTILMLCYLNYVLNDVVVYSCSATLKTDN